MKNIKCSAVNCIHNRENACDAMFIKVRPAAPESEDGAQCSSFAYLRPGANHTLLMELGMDMTMNRTNRDIEVGIQCDAVSCLHNAGKKCRASTIDVEGLYHPRGKPACKSFRED